VTPESGRFSGVRADARRLRPRTTRATTGEEYERAHVPDDARALLADHDEFADHYEVVASEEA
jgi:hypothetical protein